MQECHLTALEKIFAVMIALNADIIVIINFEYSEKRISEKYLSLSDIVAKQYNQHTYVVVVALILESTKF